MKKMSTQDFTKKDFVCRHNLFITNPIIVRIRVTWEKRYRKERFVNTKKLRGKYDNPLSPEEMKKKIEEHCGGAKDLLMNVNMISLKSYFF